MIQQSLTAISSLFLVCLSLYKRRSSPPCHFFSQPQQQYGGAPQGWNAYGNQYPQQQNMPSK